MAPLTRGGRFWYDQPYVSERASANRQYYRQALYWDYPVLPNLSVTAHWQHASSTRKELLLGFFDVINATQLRGYYRQIDEANQQSDAGLTVRGTFETADVQHRWSAVAQHLQLARSFEGPQNIGGFTLALANPVFPANLTGLPLSARYAFENYSEQGVALADLAQWGEWTARFGVRRSRFDLSASTAPSQAPLRLAEAAKVTYSYGLERRLALHQRAWLSRTESFLPNRGRFSGGGFLPPSSSGQWEAGWGLRKPAAMFSVAAFRLSQSNLPARDPKDRDAFILLGQNRSVGVDVKLDLLALGVRWQAAATRQHARVQTAVSATQGRFLTGMPDVYGSLRVSTPLEIAALPGVGIWARLQAAGRRPGDSTASFYAPGYGVTSAGMEVKPSSGGVAWGVHVHNLADRRYVRALTGADNVWQGPRRSLQVWAESAF